jgi:hypothetical protein
MSEFSHYKEKSGKDRKALRGGSFFLKNQFSASQKAGFVCRAAPQLVFSRVLIGNWHEA